MDIVFALIAVLLPWITGTALLWYFATFFKHKPGLSFRLIGAGAFAGLALIALLMRGSALLGIAFSFWLLALLLILIAALTLFFAIRRTTFSCNTCTWRSLSPTARVIGIGLLLWIIARFVLLWIEVTTQPLFPWEATLQSGAQAHVLFGQGKLFSFVDSQAWLNQSGSDLYFSLTPSFAQTLPLLQAWVCIAVGEWNDALMNLPWWVMLAALGFGVYGFVRQSAGVLLSLVATWLVTSLPLLNTHAALAGLPDLPLASAYTLAALALAGYAQSRNRFDLIVFGLLTLVAASFWQVSYIWLATLFIALPFAFLIRWMQRGAAALLAAAVLGILLLAQFGETLTPQFFGIQFAFDAEQWRALFIDGENWHLLWFVAIITLFFGIRRIFDTPCGILTMILIGALTICIASICMPQLGVWLFGAVHAGRIILIAMPLLTVWCVAVWLAMLNVPEENAV